MNSSTTTKGNANTQGVLKKYEEATRRHEAASNLIKVAERALQSKDYKKASYEIGKAQIEIKGVAIFHAEPNADIED